MNENIRNGMVSEDDIKIIEDLSQIARAQEAQKDGKPAFKPPVRVHRHWLGTVNWEKHKHNQAMKRKAANQRARKARKTQRHKAS